GVAPGLLFLRWQFEVFAQPSMLLFVLGTHVPNGCAAGAIRLHWSYLGDRFASAADNDRFAFGSDAVTKFREFRLGFEQTNHSHGSNILVDWLVVNACSCFAQ